MQNLHLKLTSKYPQYHNWHQTKHHNKIHWGVFIVFTFIVFVTMLRWTPITFAADIAAPTTPTSLTATAISLTQINLSWTASTDDVGVIGYKIYRCSGLACAPTTQISTSATNSYSNTGLTASTAYTYAVSAYDAAGNDSGKSASVSATTQASSLPQGSLSIPLTIAEPAGVGRINEPITSGIPLPAGTQTTAWSLWEDGNEVPLQITPLKGRTPWILLDFQTSVEANGTKNLILKDIPASAAPAKPVNIMEDAGRITVTTGPLKVSLNKTNFNLFDEVWLDKDNSGSFTDTEQVVSSSGDNIQIVDSTSGQTFSGAGVPDKLVWEYKGSTRATLRVEGRYRSGSGEFIAYTTKITFYAGQSFIKIEHILRNSYQLNERHVKISSATIKIGSGATSVRATRSGSISWANMDSGEISFELMPTTFGSASVNTDTNGGMLLPDLSHHGATCILDFSEGLSTTEQINRSKAAHSPLFVLAPSSWYSANGAFGVDHFGTLDDEKQSYQNWGWTWKASQELNMPHLPDYDVNWKRIDVHDDLEADDLWQNLLMYARSGLRGYLDRSMGWAHYYKWQYAYRTDGFAYAWDSDYEGPTKVSRPLISIPLTSADQTYLGTDVKPGRIDIRGWGADHAWAGGLIDFYYLTGDVNALEAAVDVAEISNRAFGWITPGDCDLMGGNGGPGCMAQYGLRPGARNLFITTRVWEATQDTQWQTLMEHIIQLWLQSPEWDSRGLYYYGNRSLPGAREQSAFQIDLLVKAFYRYYLLTGNTTIKDRIIAMSRWAQQYGLHQTYQYTGAFIALDYPNSGNIWHYYFDNGLLGDFDPFYTISMVDVLTIGYRLTGDQTLLDRAKLHWDRGSKGVYHDVTAITADPNQVSRFVNNLDLYPPTKLLYLSGGDLSYVHLLFYDAARASIRLDITPPTTPTNLTATAISSSQINLSWTASADDVAVTGYKIYRDGIQFAASTTTTYSDAGLSSLTTYLYTIAAYDAAGNTSAQSASVSVTTLQALTPPKFTAVWTKMNPIGDTSIDPRYQLHFGGSSLPADRAWFPLAFDNKRNVNVLFGGGGGSYLGAPIGYNNQLWYYSLSDNKWTLIEPEVKCPNTDVWPNGRDNHELIYDNYNDLYWMFGGTGWQCGRASDGIIRTGGLWSYDPNQKIWKLWFPSGDQAVEGIEGPPATRSSYDPGFAYSPDHRKIIKVGGGGNYEMTTWIFDVVKKEWIDTGIKNVIPYRSQTENALVYDSFYKVFIFFGGSKDSDGDGMEDTYLNDTWVYSIEKNTWILMNPPVSPPPRHMHAMVYDSQNKFTVLFGGSTGTAKYNDTWIYDYATNTWTEVTPASSPPSIDLHAMAYDSMQKMTVAFKGHIFENWGTWTLKLVPSESDNVSPNPPTGLTVTAVSSTQIDLSWTASTDNIGVIGYKIYRCAGSTCAPTVQIATSTTNSYSNTGLTASTAYTYAVSAYDAAGNESGKSGSASATTLSQFKPSDLNQDRKVDQLDFDILKQDWNRTDKPVSDLNQDGVVDSRDLGIMMSEWTR